MSVFQPFSHLLPLAYIDPGTGSFLMQMLIAGRVVAIAYFREAVFGLFRPDKGKKLASQASSAGPDRAPSKGTEAPPTDVGPDA